MMYLYSKTTIKTVKSVYLNINNNYCINIFCYNSFILLSFDIKAKIKDSLLIIFDKSFSISNDLSQ